MFIEHLQRPPRDVPAIPITVTKQDYDAFWKKARERTSSSISGAHFGHYKAAVGNDTIAEFHACFTELAFSYGCSIERWQRGLQALLEKLAGCTAVEKLRAILLLEADFNFATKLFLGFRMMNNAHAAGLLPPELTPSGETSGQWSFCGRQKLL
jgi:hypothetical protein